MIRLHRQNVAIYEELAPHGSVVGLRSGEVIAVARVEIHKVYFQHHWIISCVVAIIGGGVSKPRGDNNRKAIDPDFEVGGRDWRERRSCVYPGPMSNEEVVDKASLVVKEYRV